jgi:hypothetical protein
MLLTDEASHEAVTAVGGSSSQHKTTLELATVDQHKTPLDLPVLHDSHYVRLAV